MFKKNEQNEQLLLCVTRLHVQIIEQENKRKKNVPMMWQLFFITANIRHGIWDTNTAQAFKSRELAPLTPAASTSRLRSRLRARLSNA